MSEFLKVFLNIRSLRAACRELTIEQLEEGLEKLTSIVEERRQAESRITSYNVCYTKLLRHAGSN